jgi:hypothetical protein
VTNVTLAEKTECESGTKYMRDFRFSAAASVKMTFFWDIALYSLIAVE